MLYTCVHKINLLNFLFMAISTSTIDDFLAKQVSQGTCASIQEAQQELIAKLIEKEIDQKIAQGRADVQVGKTRVLNEENNAQFLETLEKKLTANLA